MRSYVLLYILEICWGHSSCRINRNYLKTTLPNDGKIIGANGAGKTLQEISTVHYPRRSGEPSRLDMSTTIMHRLNESYDFFSLVWNYIIVDVRFCIMHLAKRK